MSKRLTERPVLEGIEHGSMYGYRKGCRCDLCTEVHSRACRDQYRSRRARLLSGVNVARLQHGTANTYSGWACRCPPCTAAYLAYRKAWRTKKEGVKGGGVWATSRPIST